MTPLARFVRRWRERLLGTYYEGPEPPYRLREMVLFFANFKPCATRQEWVEFASHHAAECYRTGYLRGLERAERDPDAQPWMQGDPDELADAMSPGWRRHSPSVFVPGADQIVGDDAPTAEELAALR